MKKLTLVRRALVVFPVVGFLSFAYAQAPDEAEQLYQQVLQNPPAAAEARVVGKRIDAMFAAVAKADSDFVAAVTKIKWGDVYDPKMLNQTEQLGALIKVNGKSLELSKKAFDAREKAFTEALKDLHALADKSLFAKAMLREVTDKYDAPETGFKAINDGMRASTIEKHESIEAKLKMLKEASGSYKLLEMGKIAFAPDDKGKALMEKYQDNMQVHNQTTARQRQLGEFFVKNQRSVVDRFHELSKT
jgi:hypothetical protein